MKQRPSAVHKFFSWSRWQRRFGGSVVVSDITNQDIEAMKIHLIDLGEAILSRGSAKDVRKHHETLRQEFSGQPELAFHHAMLIVLIRREFELSKTYAEFENLWKNHGDWLLEHLNIRWLVSACDTFADHSKDPTVRALALATTLLANTVKAYETENVMTHHEQVVYAPQIIARVQQTAIPLMGDMSCYTVGTDDTLRNMVWRMKDIAPAHVTGKILMEVFQRLTTLPTAFGRLRQKHTRAKTQFWE